MGCCARKTTEITIPSVYAAVILMNQLADGSSGFGINIMPL